MNQKDTFKSSTPGEKSAPPRPEHILKALELGAVEQAENAFSAFVKDHWSSRYRATAVDYDVKMCLEMSIDDCPLSCTLVESSSSVLFRHVKSDPNLLANAVSSFFDGLNGFIVRMRPGLVLLVGAVETQIIGGEHAQTFTWKAKIGIPA